MKGPKWPFLLILIVYEPDVVIILLLGQVCTWVELPVQMRLCPIFVSGVGLPDIHEYLAGCWVVNGPPILGGHSLVSEHMYTNT